jgi:hypothetical protein
VSVASGIGYSWPEQRPSWAERTRFLARTARLGTLGRLGTPARMRTLGRWRAVGEHGFVLDILLQRLRDTEAAKAFVIKLPGAYDVPEVI